MNDINIVYWNFTQNGWHYLELKGIKRPQSFEKSLKDIRQFLCDFVMQKPCPAQITRILPFVKQKI